jgi:ubiquinone/menaquinone biosynthesis C-methylase UbiE
MVFDQNTANLPRKNLKSAFGQYIFSRQKELILYLVAPCSGERILDVNCDTGDHLQIFKEKWCSVTGINPSAQILQKVKNKLGADTEIVTGKADDLPFSDNEFDIVTLINVLETAKNPQKVLSEAIRVCRGRVFIGFLNNLTLAGTKQKLKELFGLPLSQEIRFFRLNEIKLMVEGTIGNTKIKWGSVLYFPAFVYSFFEELEEMLPLENNPLGAFTGLVVPVKYTFQTVQTPLMESFNMNRKAQRAAPGTARDMVQEMQK